MKLAQQLMAEEDDDDDEDVDSNKQDSVQMVTDQCESVDNYGASANSTKPTGISEPSRLTETHVDASGHLETQIN